MGKAATIVLASFAKRISRPIETARVAVVRRNKAEEHLSRNQLAGILKSYALSGTSNYIRRVKLICLETSTGEPMTIELRELYGSPNGDRWYLARDVDLGQVFIRHEPNLPSGGKAENIEVGAFLSQSGQGPEHRELLRLIGTLVGGNVLQNSSPNRSTMG